MNELNLNPQNEGRAFIAGLLEGVLVILYVMFELGLGVGFADVL